VEVLDVTGEPPDLRCQRGEQGPPQLRLLVDQREERVAVETSVSVGSIATIVAECGAPSRIASSPKNSPVPRIATIAGSAPSSTAARP
jgi:hypothetical protein